MKRRYVVAFNRDRDFYQVPLALAECGRLEGLITDFYCPDTLVNSRFSNRLGFAHRHCPGIPSSKVSNSLVALALQLGPLRWAKSNRERTQVFRRLDAVLSRKAQRIGVSRGADLLLYSGYALEAFSQAQRGQRKVLFVYHPQGDYARAILEEDVAQHPEVADSYERHLAEIEVTEGDRFRQEIAMADTILCASSFTRKSVEHVAGSDAVPIHVVPYGCATTASTNDVAASSSRPQVLFVGQGSQRKGLHHLLHVWSKGLYREADLTLILNRTDTSIGKMIADLPGRPRVLSNLDRDALREEFAKADIFAMPSLVEGFGLVYLEALGAGCHVIGTSNTGLPDLNAPPEAVTIVKAGDLQGLETGLDQAIHRAASDSIDCAAIMDFAASRNWERFRGGIRKALDLEASGDVQTSTLNAHTT